MKRFSITIVSAVLTFAIFFSSLPTTMACGPFTVDPLFSFTKHLDYPVANHTNANIGVVPDTYGRISLFVFYRQLNNLPFTDQEKTEVARAIGDRIGTHWSENREANSEAESNSEKPPMDPAPDRANPLEKWKAARAKVTGGDIKTDVDKPVPGDYGSYTNCLDDAFSNAVRTLNDRLAKYGATDDVKEWVKGQDAVFSNCGANGQVPSAVSDTSPEWLKKDRPYQIAAALFYGEKFPESRKTFEEIAADNSSVWKNTAKFVVARTLIRQSSFIDDTQPDYEEATKVNTNTNLASNTNSVSNGTPLPKSERKEIKSVDEKKREKVELLEKADKQLQGILTDASMKEFHESAHRLLNLVRYRGNPKQQRSFLAERLVQPGENTDIFNNLTDYVWLLDKVESDAREKGMEFERKEAEQSKKEYDYNYDLKLRDIDKEEMGRDLTDWLYSYQAADSFAHSFDKWKQTRRLAWFVAALVKAEKDSPALAELLGEADKIPSNSPAFPTVRYHQIQLLLETGKRAEAKQKLTEMLGANFKTFSRSTQNKFLAQRLILAESLDDFLKYAQRQPATFVWSDDGSEEGTELSDNKDLKSWNDRTMFDEDSVAFFNERMPLTVLRQAALSPNLPEHLKKFLVVAVWTRAFVLKNQTIEREFAPLVARYDKNLAPSFSTLAGTTNPTEREAAALLAVFNNPGIQPYVPFGLGRESGAPPKEIDSIRGNWWCVEEESLKGESHYDHYPFTYPKAYPQFLTAAQTAEAKKEHQQLAVTGASATSLAKRALDFATLNPGNPATPQILHLAVRSTRYGCTDDDTLKLSKANFDFLHKRFPGNEWTKKTPYYFGKR